MQADGVTWRAKEVRERAVAAVAFALTSPVLAAAAIAIKVEGLLDRRARGPVFFRETRISHGREIQLLKLRTLDAASLASLRRRGLLVCFGTASGPVPIAHVPAG